MNEFPYPKASLLPLTCPHCQEQRPEHGGYRVRKLRDVQGIREVKVMKVRCRGCHKQLACLYPPGVFRYKWYSSNVEGIFAILDVHQVDEGCANEIAEWLGYAIKPSTRANWQATRAWRSERLQAQQPRGKLEIAGIDEFRVGSWWVYTLTEVESQAVLGYGFSLERDEEMVRELIAEYDPKAIISDGCKTIAAASAWFADKPHGRCWFHVIKEVLSNFSKNERELVAHDLAFLYTRDTLAAAEWFLSVLKERYDEDKLAPLCHAWQQLKLYWLVKDMPLTNNASETLYHALWPRSRKRVARALHRALDWFKEALWRWHHHLVRGKSPWQRFCKQPSPHWLTALLTPLGRSSDF